MRPRRPSPLAAPVRALRARPRSVGATLAVAVLASVLVTVPATSGAFIATVRNPSNTAGSASFFTCGSASAEDDAGALFSYTLAQPSGATVAPDTASGAEPGTYRSTGEAQSLMVSSDTTPHACPRDGGGAWSLDGTDQYLSSPLSLVGPTTFSTEIWFATTVAGGKLFSFSTGATAPGGQYDRHTYIGADGHLVFGVYDGEAVTITSPQAVDDGAWHHVVSTLSPTSGLALWLDGKQVAASADYRAPEAFTGTWKIGYDALGGVWPNVGPAYFSGSLRFATVYSTLLTPTQIWSHYVAGR
ncbi:LamG domain-containing protein [Rathayibacter agropyri]|uniref:LamG domain-containing protein n=1 Tax=Rathayibacter agropyri TaxID=1634927 RepID=UPI0031B61368